MATPLHRNELEGGTDKQDVCVSMFVEIRFWVGGMCLWWNLLQHNTGDLEDTDKPNQHMCLPSLEWHLQHGTVNQPHVKTNQFSRHGADQQEIEA